MLPIVSIVVLLGAFGLAVLAAGAEEAGRQELLAGGVIGAQNCRP